VAFPLSLYIFYTRLLCGTNLQQDAPYSFLLRNLLVINMLH
jgi:hypothetical protein